MIERSPYLREADTSDLEILFEWANDEVTRANAFSTNPIGYEEHISWFHQMMENPTEKQYILMDGNEPCGQIRLSINDDTAEIDYSISMTARGSGYGKEIIRLIKIKVHQEHPNIVRLISRVRPSNVASFYCLEKNGFEEKYKQLEFDMCAMDEVHDNDWYESAENTSVVQTGLSCRVLFLTNNRNTLRLFDWITEHCDAEIYSGRLSIEYLESLKPTLVVSYNYIYLISQECIVAVDGNIINMHISYLPWNRGFSPNIWSFIDGTPKGVTIHMLSEGLDEGDILFQREVVFDEEKENFESTHVCLNEMIVDLFIENWDSFASGEYKRLRSKQTGRGTYHTIADLRKLKEEISFDWSDNIAEFLRRYRNNGTIHSRHD